MTVENKKISFWALLSLVMGSQIGSSVFMSPLSLAPFGTYAIWGWIFSGLGAMALALVFAEWCTRCPKTGGPHAYIQNAFGSTLGFFSGWTYWVISWVSTVIVITTAAGYLSPLFGGLPGFSGLVLQIALLSLITWVNIKGVQTAGSIELVLNLLKVIPLIVVPFLCLFSFDIQNFQLNPELQNLSSSQAIAKVTMLIFWGFVGLESGTTPAESVENPKVTIPKAVIFGTLAVAVLYFINGVAIMGVIPGSVLAHSKAPYGDAVQIICGQDNAFWHQGISLVAAIVCIGTLNAWILVSGQIALGLAEDGFLPSVFGKKNAYDAPQGSILISYFGLLILLFLTFDEHLAKQINNILDLSTTSFVYIYLLCAGALFKTLIQEKSSELLPKIASIGAIIFCLWLLWDKPLLELLTPFALAITGVPFFIWIKRSLGKESF